MNQGILNGILLAIAWLVLVAVSGLEAKEADRSPAEWQAPSWTPPQPEHEPLRITPNRGEAREADEDNGGGGWQRRRTTFA